MERNIRVVDSAAQNSFTLSGDFTTLADLKAAICQSNNQSARQFDGKTFMVAIAKVELKTDDSLLPTDVPTASGETTNDLTVLITSAHKKTASGVMSRQECYAFFKKNAEAASALKDKEGKNYTNVPTDALVAFIISFEEPSTPAEASCPADDLITELKEEVYVLWECEHMDDMAYDSLMSILDPDFVTEEVSDEEREKLFGGWAE